MYRGRPSLTTGSVVVNARQAFFAGFSPFYFPNVMMSFQPVV